MRFTLEDWGSTPRHLPYCGWNEPWGGGMQILGLLPPFPRQTSCGMNKQAGKLASKQPKQRMKRPVSKLSVTGHGLCPRKCPDSLDRERGASQTSRRTMSACLALPCIPYVGVIHQHSLHALHVISTKTRAWRHSCPARRRCSGSPSSSRPRGRNATLACVAASRERLVTSGGHPQEPERPLLAQPSFSTTVLWIKLWKFESRSRVW